MKKLHRFTSFIFLKENGEYIDSKDGIVYIMLNGRIKRYFSKVFCGIQWVLWKLNINIHNPISGECTPDFSCCLKK